MTLPASGAIAFSCINTELGLNSTAQISMNDTAVRGLFGQASGAIDMNTGHGKSSTTVPGAPTSVSATATGSTTASVTFTAPASNGGATIDTYQAISTPGCITATGASSPISVTGLSGSTSYTFKVRAHNSKGYGSYSSSSSSITTNAAPGSTSYTSPGCYTFIVPAGVTSVSAVAVGAGATGHGGYGYPQTGVSQGQGGCGGNGGSLRYKNNYSVTPGASISVKVGSSVVSCNPSHCSIAQSWFVSQTVLLAQGAGGGTTNNAGDGGGNGVNGGGGYQGAYRSDAVMGPSGGGGGAGGYTSQGGYGGAGRPYVCTSANGKNAGACGIQQGGGGGGGSGGTNYGYQGTRCGYGGGGVGIFGQGSSGSGGAATYCASTGNPGTGGSGGSSGSGHYGGAYGGGGAGYMTSFGAAHYDQYGSPYDFTAFTTSGIYTGGSGAVRVLWPGASRQFPTTCVGSP